MGDTESALPASKKRTAGRQITKDNPDDDAPELEMGTFQKASDEVLAARRIIKVRRQQQPPAVSSNPFASICLVPQTDSSAKLTSSAEPQTAGGKEVLEEQDGSKENQEKSGEDKGTQGGPLADELNGTEKSSMKIEDKIVVSAAENAKLKNVVQEIIQPVVSVENGIEETDKVSGEETGKEYVEETKKEVGEETNKTLTEKSNEDASEESQRENPVNDQGGKTEPASSVNVFQHLSRSQNAFTGIAGTGFSSSSFTFGSISKEGSGLSSPSFSFGSHSKEGSGFGGSSGPGSSFGSKDEKSYFPSFGNENSNNGNSLFQPSGTPVTVGIRSAISGTTAIQEVPVETGEENDRSVFTASAILFEYLDGGWKERGKGELKVNVTTTGDEKARLIMRARGNYRLILNASLYPDMSLKNMDKKGITFACMNSAGEGKAGLVTFALKFKDSCIVEEFREIVTMHKGKKATGVETPENSPKASDD